MTKVPALKDLYEAYYGGGIIMGTGFGPKENITDRVDEWTFSDIEIAMNKSNLKDVSRLHQNIKTITPRTGSPNITKVELEKAALMSGLTSSDTKKLLKALYGQDTARFNRLKGLREETDELCEDCDEELEETSLKVGQVVDIEGRPARVTAVNDGSYMVTFDGTPRAVHEGNMTFWDVFLNGKEIDSVPYVKSMDAEEVKKSLIDHDGFDSRIVVKKGK